MSFAPIWEYPVYPIIMLDKEDIGDDKIIVHQKVLQDIMSTNGQEMPSQPIYLVLTHPILQTRVTCGILEFTDKEGVFVPQRIRDILCIQGDEKIQLFSILLAKASLIKIQPHETAFINLPDPRAVLEKHLTKYSSLTKGETISINYADHEYYFYVVDTQPNEQVSLINTDVNLEFEEPVDYVPPKPLTPSNKDLYEKSDEDKRFPGTGYRLGSK